MSDSKFNRYYEIQELPEALAEQRTIVANLKEKVNYLKRDVKHFELQVEKLVQYAPKEMGISNDPKREIYRAELLDQDDPYCYARIELEKKESELVETKIELQFLEDTFEVLKHVGV